LGGRGRQISEFEASLVYKLSSRTARATQKKPACLKKKKKKKKKKRKKEKKNRTHFFCPQLKPYLDGGVHVGEMTQSITENLDFFFSPSVFCSSFLLAFTVG
jgi:hypothetical protein